MPPETHSWAYDAIARVYDDDMALSAPPGDVEYYVRACGTPPRSVLELGCGTGRITLKVALAGHSVTAVDRSGPMLRVLETKAGELLGAAERARLRAVEADMRDLPFPGDFDVVLCPYSAFTYLLTDEDRERMLDGVRERLRPGGRLFLDVFVPDPALTTMRDGEVIFDYRRPRSDGTWLERSKTITRDVRPGVNALERRYRILDAAGTEVDRFTTRNEIHYWQPEELRTELGRCGFDAALVYDFGRAPEGRVKTAVFECLPITSRG